MKIFTLTSFPYLSQTTGKNDWYPSNECRRVLWLWSRSNNNLVTDVRENWELSPYWQEIHGENIDTFALLNYFSKCYHGFIHKSLLTFSFSNLPCPWSPPYSKCWGTTWASLCKLLKNWEPQTCEAPAASETARQWVLSSFTTTAHLTGDPLYGLYLTSLARND